jgi:hypothetical protein
MPGVSRRRGPTVKRGKCAQNTTAQVPELRGIPNLCGAAMEVTYASVIPPVPCQSVDLVGAQWHEEVSSDLKCGGGGGIRLGTCDVVVPATKPETEEGATVTLKRGFLIFLIGLAVNLGALAARGEEPAACRWLGPPSERVLARHPPAGEIAGSLGLDVVPFLQRGGIPVSFVSTPAGNEHVRLVVGPTTTMREVLREIFRQAPTYRYSTVNDRLVIYPQDGAYDAAVDLKPPQRMTRAAAFFFVLRGLRAQVKVLQDLDPILRGGGAHWGKTPLEDEVEIGGAHSVIEHLVSLVQKRPSEAFRMTANGDRIGFTFVEIGLLTKLHLHLPSIVKVGETFMAEVSATLNDGTLVSLMGPECEVSFAALNPEVVRVDDKGLATAVKRGVGAVVAAYELNSAKVDVRVED